MEILVASGAHKIRLTLKNAKNALELSNNIFRVYSDISKLFKRANAAYDIGNVFMLGFGDQGLFYQFCHFKESVLKFGCDEKSSGKNWTLLHTDGFDFSAPN